MRKLKLQMQMSVDGFVSTGPNDEQKWVTWAWHEIRQDVLDLFDSTDTILIGRGLATDYIPYWESTYKNTGDPMHEVAERIVRAKKIVFTNTLTKSEWPNTTIANGNLVDEIRQLKAQPGKDVIVYGGSAFVSSLIKGDLVDEFHLFVNPVAIGKGVPIFDEVTDFFQLKLKKSKAYDCGIILNHYERGD